MADKPKGKGAPADFPGPVFPNPHNIAPRWDTDPTPAKFGVGKFHMSGAKGDVQKVDVKTDPAHSSVMTPEQLREPHISSYKHGTDYVPKTGPALLHRGEKVVPAKENKMDPFAGITKGDKKPKKEIKDMVLSKSHNGKHIMTHKHHHPEHHPDETHVLSDMAELHGHMDDHAGTPNAGEAAPADGAAGPAPLTAAPSPMPTPGA